jgi:hypothetical protein
MLNVFNPVVSKEFLASISFGFDREGEDAGPFLDPLNPQSKYANALLPLVEAVLSDPAYIARLESHYRQVKEALADKKHPIHGIIARADYSRLGRRRKRRKRIR